MWYIGNSVQVEKQETSVITIRFIVVQSRAHSKHGVRVS